MSRPPFLGYMVKKRKHIYPAVESIDSVVNYLKEDCEVDYMPKDDDMLPLIRGGKDVVTLRSPDRDLTCGDIVLADVDKKGYRLLRILDRNQNRFLLVGDSALDVVDIEECTVNDIAGRVIYIQRGDLGFRPGNGKLWMRLFSVRKLIMGIYRRLKKNNQ